MSLKRKRLDDAIDSALGQSKREKVEKIEKLLDPSQSRFTVFPIREPEIWQFYKNQLASFWVPEEIDFSNDRRDYETLNEETKHFVKMTLAFFAASDGIVNFNIGERFAREIKVMEAQICYDYQKAMENIHGECYSIMLNEIIRDPEEREKLFDAINQIEVISEMAKWALKWIDSDRPFACRLVAFALVEGVFFSGAFASIFWIKKHRGGNFMNGLIKSNEFIARDEGMHTDFACLLYTKLENRLTDKEVNEITTEAVEISIRFANELLRSDLLGINKHSMAEYIKYTADRLLVSLGHSRIYSAKNPFDFIATIGLPGKTNFFESRPTEYQAAAVLNSSSGSGFKILSDF